MAIHIGNVVCAIIERGDQFLIARRPKGRHLEQKWEFPGGKAEQGESEIQALERELYEELRIRVEILQRLTPVEHCYPERCIRLIPFICRISEGEPVACDHEELRWIAIEETDGYDFPEADAPILDEYRRRFE
ncbi:MAG: (deoxy)nucleoside triphosphate pyrophosphohydrolase [Chlorobiaceae bacterium]|nr:(deoxy)nucleoside triphosphate pyrophosphohydrolase [Chlorobiaceae bacterium]